MRYPDLPPSLLALEEEVLARWEEESLFQKTLEATAEGPPFVFYEGPPTANGRPGLHHILSRTIKDLVCRYQTMQGRHVTRIAGWDTHGLPVEIEAERKLGISGKPEIEATGIATFNQACRDSVFTYKEEWESLSGRIGYWLDYSRPYVTFHPEYIESVWWILKSLSERGLLYRGFKSVPYCPRCGTALSSHEVAQGYREVEDPSLYFLCRLLSDDGTPDPEGRAFLVWTTTPWTVPSNTALAVHPELEYVEVASPKGGSGRIILAAARVEAVLGDDVEVLERHRGADLVGRRYARPMELVPEPAEASRAWTVVAEGFVSASDGTGLVHLAPAFGADDYAAGQRHGLPLIRPVDDAGRFVEEVDRVGGLGVKEADPVVLEALEESGNLFRVEAYVHSYPHCWRCDAPLIYMARSSWFAATSTLKDDLLANNADVSWHPPEVGEKRFGEWLEGNVDWALSRDRYWGTPLPAWVCDEDPEHVEWIGAFDELADRSGGLPEDFDPHRPTIDEIHWPCRQCSGVMRRTPEVLDVWFDSGSMPWAQWHYPFENESEFENHFPADFICEGLDQTRGWFYSLMAVSTMLGKGTSYRSVVVNDLILDAEGQKMSKSRGNTVNPWDAVADHGADGLRWYLVTSSNPWVPKRYDPDGVGEAAGKFLDTLFNSYRFFALYANTEEWTPSDGEPSREGASVLDRWLRSRLDSVVTEVRDELDRYQITRAYRAVNDFLVDDLSNWYVRRSRPRFWGNADRADADAAFRTLWDALRTMALLVAPVTPFTADWFYRALTGASAHLTPFPEVASAPHAKLEEDMVEVRRLVSLGRAARESVQIRVRQPLPRLFAVLPDGGTLSDDVLGLVRDELNVKEVTFISGAEELVRLVAKPNFRALGPRFQQHSEEAAATIRELDSAALEAFRSGGELAIEVGGARHVLGPDDLEIAEEAMGDLVVRSEQGTTVALDPTVDEQLRREGLARELVNRIQRLRKEAGLEITDRISLGVFGSDEVQTAARSWESFIAGETLATDMAIGPEGESGFPDGFETSQEVELEGSPAVIGLTAVRGGRSP